MTTKELREMLDLSVEEFAVKVRASSRTIHYWEAGDKKIDDPGIMHVFRDRMKNLARRVV